MNWRLAEGLLAETLLAQVLSTEALLAEALLADTLIQAADAMSLPSAATLPGPHTLAAASDGVAPPFGPTRTLHRTFRVAVVWDASVR